MKRILLFAMLVVPMALLLSSCAVRREIVVRSGPDGMEVATYQYLYYPSIEVYFDVERKVYYYPEDSGWHKSSKPPTTFYKRGSHVSVEMDTDKPYRDFDKHRAKYRR